MQVSFVALLVSLTAAAEAEVRNLIITYGPPASGKSVAYGKWSGIVRPDHGGEVHKLEISVDDMVLSNPQYQLVAKDMVKGVNPLLRNPIYQEACYKDHPEDICGDFFQAEVDFCQKGLKNYSSYRQQANNLSNSLLLEQAMLTGKLNDKEIEDVVYEVSGSDESYEWMLSVAKLAKGMGMKVHLVYPIVSLNNLKKRALQSAIAGHGHLPCAWATEDFYEQAAKNFAILLDDDAAKVHFHTITVVDNDSDQAETFLHYNRDIFKEDIQYDNACHAMQSLTRDGKWPDACQMLLSQ